MLFDYLELDIVGKNSSKKSSLELGLDMMSLLAMTTFLISEL